MTDNTVKVGDEFALINWHGFGPRRISKVKVHEVSKAGWVRRYEGDQWWKLEKGFGVHRYYKINRPGWNSEGLTPWTPELQAEYETQERRKGQNALMGEVHQLVKQVNVDGSLMMTGQLNAVINALKAIVEPAL